MTTKAADVLHTGKLADGFGGLFNVFPGFGDLNLGLFKEVFAVVHNRCVSGVRDGVLFAAVGAGFPHRVDDADGFCV